MKKILILGIVAAFTFSACNTVSSSKTPKTEMDSVAYCLGLSVGNSVINMNESLSTQMIASGIQAMIDEKATMTLDEAYAFLDEYFQIRKPLKNLKESEDFLAEMEKKSGVQKTESGLLYEIIEEGTVKATSDADTLTVAYKGSFPDGKVFDSTEQQGVPSRSFPLNSVIEAWKEGMKLVGEGGKIKLYAAPGLAYGDRGNAVIPPNQAIVFEVEVLEVKPAAEVAVEE